MEKKSFFKAYELKFSGLKPGKHEFEFQIHDDFFSHYEESPVQESDVKVRVDFDKQNDVLYTLTVYLKGTISLNCDRCLCSFPLPVDENYRLVMKIESNREDKFNEDIIYVSPHDSKVNLADHFYEFVLLQIPLKKTCDLGNQECDSEMINKLNQIAVNKELRDTEESPWEKLKEFKNKFKEE
ncbi:DUF177 domain-containing protein [Bacteroidota bacterium]